MRFSLYAVILAIVIAMSAPCKSFAEGAGELLSNGGLEGGGGSDGAGAGVPHWNAWTSGYEVDRADFHAGEQSARCDALRPDKEHGISQEVVLNQKRAAPIVVSAWSKADHVSGSKDVDYALYVDLVYQDGTFLYGQTAPFRTGTHAWERRQVLITPLRPVRKMTVIGLFRKHTGTVWFDDLSANQMDGAGIFDGQPLLPLAARRAGTEGAPLTVKGGDGLSLNFDPVGNIVGVHTGALSIGSATVGGFWVRDVAAGTAPGAMRGTAKSRAGGGVTVESTSDPMGLRFTGRVVPEDGAIAIDGDVFDTTHADRAVTVYFALPVGADGWRWGDDIRRSSLIRPDQEQSSLTHVNVGATSGISLYPLGCVSNNQTGVALANQMDMPSVYRIFYNGPTHQLVIAWDFALTGKSSSWPKYQAHFHARLFALNVQEAQWGFRAALKRFYGLNRPNYDRLAKAEGIWAPFTSPTSVKGYQDFGFAYHEGDNSKKADNAAGILCFRYTEPMTWWMPMPADMPRTYENAMVVLNGLASKLETITPQTPRPTAGELARSVIYSGSKDDNGQYNLEFRNEPWGNGAVFVLNPNPEMPASADRPTRGYLNFNAAIARSIYSPEAARLNGTQDGEYLDSLEGWSDTLDFRPENIGACPYPLTFETDSRKTVLPQWFSTHTFTRSLRDDLHNRGKLLFANSVPIRFSIYSSVLDVMGIEVNWLNQAGQFEPEPDETMSMRRALSGTKPYLLLMNTNYDKFTHAMVEQYIRASMFYGIYPSMFSQNAADNAYWATPKWYDRDRDLFKKYIPIIKRLSSAGWEPITHARSADSGLALERYGPRLFTLRNLSPAAITGAVTINLKALNLPAGSYRVVDIITGNDIKSSAVGADLQITVSVPAGDSTAIELK